MNWDFELVSDESRDIRKVIRQVFKFTYWYIHFDTAPRYWLASPSFMYEDRFVLKATRISVANSAVHTETLLKASHVGDLIVTLVNFSIMIGCSDLAMKSNRSCQVSEVS